MLPSGLGLKAMTTETLRQIYWTLVWFANTDTNVQWTAASDQRSLFT
jgi:hypothetical protein